MRKIPSRIREYITDQTLLILRNKNRKNSPGLQEQCGWEGPIFSLLLVTMVSVITPEIRNQKSETCNQALI